MAAVLKELSDGRYIGHNAIEITSFPAIDMLAQPSGEALQRTADLFRQAICEFHKLGRDGSNTCGELLWITDAVQKQTFRSRIRVFFILRRIGASRDALLTELASLQSNFITLLSAQHYETDLLDESNNFLNELLHKVDKSCVFAVVKNEKCAGNANSLYPYYYCDVLPQDNFDNFNMLIAALSQYEDCCISFQIFPAVLREEEAYVLNEQSAALSRIADGILTEHQVLKDEAAVEPQKVMTYYSAHAHSPLFQYNVLVFGNRITCAGLAAKVISLLQAGKKAIGKTDCGCIDLTNEHLDIEKQFVIYPWNVNSKLLHTYRNIKLLQTLKTANVLYRLPYLLTADEAACFFRLPLHEKSMTAIQSARDTQSFEQFNVAVTDENNISIGALIGNPDINIYCPEKAFTKHALIVGMPGSGKTTFAVNLLLQFAQRGIPFLAIEPTKSEYRALIDAIPNLQVFTPGNNTVAPFIINPFLPPQGIRIEQYIPSLASAFKAAFAMPSPLDILFLKAIRTCYMEFGWKDYSQLGDNDVTVFGLHEFILCFKRIIAASNYSREVKGNIESGGVFRLMNLIEQNSNIYDTINTVPIADLLHVPTVLELNAIDNAEQKALIIALLLINICLYTKHNQLCDGELKNVILIDEAHVLLAGTNSVRSDGADSQGATIKALQDMIVEIRSYGTSILIADQAPTKVSREVVANTDIKISFRLVQSSEKELIADSTNMGENTMQQLSRLKPGEAYVYYSQLEMPQLVMTSDIRQEKGIRLVVPNNEIASRMHYWVTRKKLLRPYAACALCNTCRDDCDFTLRSQADYYAARLYEKNVSAIKDTITLMHYLTSMDGLLKNVSKELSVEQRKRLINCCRIKLARKLELENSIVLSQKDIKAIMMLDLKD